MPSDVRVHLLPSLFEPDDLRGGIAVVIDVLRASTTIVHALAAGAASVIPCGSVEESRQQAANLSGERVLLGGERNGTLIKGFDLDNSPLRYTEETVAGRTVIFTTTNGTGALLWSNRADRVLLGAFVNLNAVVQLLANEQRPVHLVCAGTEGHITSEDCLCAGAIATGLATAVGLGEAEDDVTRMVVDLFAVRGRCREEFHKAMRHSRGGRNLIALGLDADIERASHWDLFDAVPEYSTANGRITMATGVRSPATSSSPAAIGGQTKYMRPPSDS